MYLAHLSSRSYLFKFTHHVLLISKGLVVPHESGPGFRSTDHVHAHLSKIWTHHTATVDYMCIFLWNTWFPFTCMLLTFRILRDFFVTTCSSHSPVWNRVNVSVPSPHPKVQSSQNVSPSPTALLFSLGNSLVLHFTFPLVASLIIKMTNVRLINPWGEICDEFFSDNFDLYPWMSMNYVGKV